MSSTLAISAANLDVLEKNMNTLANNVGDVYQSVANVTGHVNDIDNKVSSVTDTVKTLEEEIKSFMLEIRESSVVGNARQTILMDEGQLDKKFGHYDEIRRRINGILQSTDMNAIKKSTMLNISEQTLVNTPNYYLAPALVALCAWILDDKALAERALKEAMARDDEKTSLLFCLINLRAGRNESSIRWLERYLNVQDPTKMDNKIVTVMNAITCGVFGNEAKDICINKVNGWVSELNSMPSYKDKQKERWIKYLESNFNEISDDSFPYLNHYVNDWPTLKKNISLSSSHEINYKKLSSIVKKENTSNNDARSQIDNLLNMLVFSYEKDELELRRDIMKNKHIIEENGNMTKALERFEQTSKIYDEYNDFFTHLSNIVLEYKVLNPNVDTRKYAFALEKNIVKGAYEDMNSSTNNGIGDINIKINDWKGSTTDGSNERELKASLSNYVEQLFEEDLSKAKLFNIKMFISIIIALVAIFLTLNQPILVFIIFIVTLGFNAYEFYEAYKTRNSIMKDIERNKKSASDILTNIIAEVVDYKFMYENNLKSRNKLMNFIDSLDADEYIKSRKNERNIRIEKGN